MAFDKPTIYPEWCVAGSDPADKTRPSSNKRQYGQQLGGSTFRQDINYQWDLIDQWTKHLDQRVATQDIYMTTDSGKASTDVEDQMGGQWVSVGNFMVGGTTIYTFNRTGN